ncbi:nuclear transport factor 2 family protein [Chitinophaga oryzae]|uniref:Nuclear transport factor 2 family protein n=1 Tax=Chitinophaga oryzae TaxID=2725414 RepID=A0AAE7D6R3_9BACT|nr:nuclear transport factor 2 family protein [Chitinophaga oryzae]QJB30957.1 nuclear transport factor 2 family protein [Chitinophaga oryzae]QJB37442.1 nuclear transport factor 2 family protein [Chitinophaga oryzae]
MVQRENIIKAYVEAYNNKDVDGMLHDMAEGVVFENVSGGTVTLSIKGRNDLRAQAEQVLPVFTERRQTIRAFRHEGDQAAIDIDYHAVVAIDLPNGLKKGDTLALTGQSVFTFSAEGKIVKLTDIS